MSKNPFLDLVQDDPIPEPEPLLIAIASPTGGGKTWSACRLARGIVGDGNFGMLDTEQGRGMHYHVNKLGDKDGFRYSYVRLDAPFSPERYQQAAEALIAKGAKLVIVDSYTHLWQSEGGTQDDADRIAKDQARRWNCSLDKVQFGSWKEPKERGHKLVLFLKSCGAHVILCIRAKHKSEMVEEEVKGRMKTVVRPLGIRPICDGQHPYEMQFVAILDPDSPTPGVPEFSYKPLAKQFHKIFAKPRQFDEEHGRQLAAWSTAAAAKKLIVEEIQKPASEAPRSVPVEPTLPPDNVDDGDVGDEAVEVWLSDDHQETAADPREAAPMIASELRREDMTAAMAQKILDENSAVISKLPAQWKNKLTDLALNAATAANAVA